MKHKMKKINDEDDLLKILISHLNKLTCFDCGEKLIKKLDYSSKDNEPLGILYYDRGECNYPKEPDIPESIFFECSECYNSWQDKMNNKISIDKNFFEHLLDCLVNQKYISELNPKTQREHQIIIDKAWNDGMKILNERIRTNR